MLNGNQSEAFVWHSVCFRLVKLGHTENVLSSNERSLNVQLNFQFNQLSETKGLRTNCCAFPCIYVF